MLCFWNLGLGMLGIKLGNFPSIPLWYVQFSPLVGLISGGRMQYSGCNGKFRYAVVDSALKANIAKTKAGQGGKRPLY